MKRKITIIFFMFIVSISLLFWQYLRVKEEIYYVETESLLYRYYDYYYAHNKQVQYEQFVSSIATKDDKLYKLLKERKIAFYPNKGFAYVRYHSSEVFIENINFTFTKFLFSKVNIGMDFGAVFHFFIFSFFLWV